jgi:transposase
MITVVPTNRIYLCCGATDMRRGINGLARMVQQILAQDPHTGAIFCFRGRKGHIVKVLSHDEQGFCLFTKRLTNGCFAWPSTKDQVAVTLTKADLSLLLDGIDWRRPKAAYRPRLAG